MLHEAFEIEEGTNVCPPSSLSHTPPSNLAVCSHRRGWEGVGAKQTSYGKRYQAKTLRSTMTTSSAPSQLALSTPHNTPSAVFRQRITLTTSSASFRLALPRRAHQAVMSIMLRNVVTSGSRPSDLQEVSSSTTRNHTSSWQFACEPPRTGLLRCGEPLGAEHGCAG